MHGNISSARVTNLYQSTISHLHRIKFRVALSKILQSQIHRHRVTLRRCKILSLQVLTPSSSSSCWDMAISERISRAALSVGLSLSTNIALGSKPASRINPGGSLPLSANGMLFSKRSDSCTPWPSSVFNRLAAVGDTMSGSMTDGRAQAYEKIKL
jgi:hypothetical protein